MNHDTHTDERRGHERYDCACPATCRAVALGEDAPWWDAEVLNLARGGLLLVCGHGFGVGEVLTVQMHLGSAETVLLVTARVARVGRLAEGKWLLGCQLAPNLRVEELQGLRHKAAGDAGGGRNV